jgi:hypothetical protein
MSDCQKRLLLYDTGEGVVSDEYHLGVLLDKVISSEKRASVFVSGEVSIADLDAKLWTFSPNYFIPHAIFDNGFKIDDYHVLLFSNLQDVVRRDTFCFFGEYKSFCEFLEKDFKQMEGFNDFIFIGKIKEHIDYSFLAVEVLKFHHNGKQWSRVMV